MARLLTVLLALVVSAPAFAELQLYICERPAWDGKEGCGPNNTYSTHSFLVESRDFVHHSIRTDTSDFREDQPVYTYRGGKGCDLSIKSKYKYHYTVTPESFNFIFAQLPKAPRNKLYTTVTLDRNTMKAVMDDVDHSNELTCRMEVVRR